MRAKEFLRSSLLVREPKFIGLMSFPAEAFPFVRREILSWILICEQKNARALGLDVPTTLNGEENGKDSGGCVFRETEVGSAIEFAVGKDFAEVGAALRYFHYFQKRDKAAGRTVQLTNEGFMTSFLFQENTMQGRIFMWLRLEFCHSLLVPERRINSTVPRVFNDIRDRCPGVRFEVHAGSDRERIAKEWQNALAYEDIAEEVRREHRRLARGRNDDQEEIVGPEPKIGSIEQDTGNAKEGAPIVEPEPVPVPAKEALGRLHDAIVALGSFCQSFFDKPMVSVFCRNVFTSACKHDCPDCGSRTCHWTLVAAARHLRTCGCPKDAVKYACRANGTFWKVGREELQLARTRDMESLPVSDVLMELSEKGLFDEFTSFAKYELGAKAFQNAIKKPEPQNRIEESSRVEPMPKTSPEADPSEELKQVARDESKDLRVRFLDAKPVDQLLGRFEERDLDVRRYERLVLDHFARALMSGGRSAWISLVIEPAKVGVAVAEVITFGALLRKPSKIVNQVTRAVHRKYGSAIPSSVELTFKKPIHLRVGDIGRTVVGHGFLPFNTGYFITGVKIGR